MKNYYSDIYRGRRVLILGHTGFKGSWLSLWLNSLGAKVSGISLSLVGQPSHYSAAELDGLIDTHFIDIRDLEAIGSCIEKLRPEFIFHLAAQALVRRSYSDPLETFSTNTIGTINVLESLRRLEHACVAVLITSDKCYENVETYYGYRETDTLGGKDPYSASKASAELAIRCYIRSFFCEDGCPVKIGVTRAGNVIGGGDWACDRIVPDIVKAWSENNTALIRNPTATRPWQYVLEPLSGYLNLGAALADNSELHGEAFNFGPDASDVYSVRQVAEKLSVRLPGLEFTLGNSDGCRKEAGLLKLCCDKVIRMLAWRPVLSFEETIEYTANWYREYYQSGSNGVRAISEEQLQAYCALAEQRKIAWAVL